MSDDHNFPPEPVRRKRRPVAQALAVMLASLLFACLLNADRLDRTARSQPYGSWQRAWATNITGPLKSLSHATRLNLPRKWLADAAGNTDPPPPRDTRTVVTAPPLVEINGKMVPNPALAPTTTTTRPVVYRTPTAADPLRVLVVGDSLMGWIGPALTDKFGDRPVKVSLDYKVGTGLARPDVINWPARLEEDIDAYNPEVIVLGFGGNDAQGMQTDDGVFQIGSKGWAQEYQRRVAQILNVVDKKAKKGKTLYWIGLPLTTRSNIEKASPDMKAAELAEIAVRPWAHFVDPHETLSPDGTYQTYLPGDDGQLVRVRENDGVHPNLAGAKRVVVPIVAAIVKERKLAP